MIKKILSITLSVLLAVTAFSGAYVQAEEETYIEIIDRAGLESIAENPDANYKLMADINMGDKDWYPIEFNGIFDGGGHVLYNLSITECNLNPSDSVDGNNNHYDTYYAGLFSKTEGATITNLHLLNVEVNINTPNHCFAAGLIGHAIDTEITDCSVKGRVYLYTTAKMFGVGGIAGFGYGYIADCRTDVTLVCVDENPDERSEQFLGAVMACGFPSIENCDIKIDGYASVTGYVHNGGLVGMHHVHTGPKNTPTFVRYNTSKTIITFFEDNRYRRAYCSAFVGEKLNKYVSIGSNVEIYYERNELFEYDKVLLPGGCDDGCNFEAVVTEYTCTERGWTTYTCTECGYSYTDDFTSPAHRPGEFTTVLEPTYDAEGLMELRCTECNELLDSKTIEKLKYVDTITLSETNKEMDYKSTAQLTAQVSPTDAYNQGIQWTSTDTEVVTVDANGVIEAVGKGEALIICSSADENTQSACGVEVKYTFKQWLIVIFLFGWIWY